MIDMKRIYYVLELVFGLVLCFSGAITYNTSGESIYMILSAIPLSVGGGVSAFGFISLINPDDVN